MFICIFKSNQSEMLQDCNINIKRQCTRKSGGVGVKCIVTLLNNLYVV